MRREGRTSRTIIIRNVSFALLLLQVLCISTCSFGTSSASSELAFVAMLGDSALLLGPLGSSNSNFLFLIILCVLQYALLVCTLVASRLMRGGAKQVGYSLSVLVSLYLELNSLGLITTIRRAMVFISCRYSTHTTTDFPDTACGSGFVALSVLTLIPCITVATWHAMIVRPAALIICSPWDYSAIMIGPTNITVRIIPALCLVIVMMVPMPIVQGVLILLLYAFICKQVSSSFAFLRLGATALVAGVSLASAFAGVTMILTSLIDSQQKKQNSDFYILLSLMTCGFLLGSVSVYRRWVVAENQFYSMAGLTSSSAKNSIRITPVNGDDDMNSRGQSAVSWDPSVSSSRSSSCSPRSCVSDAADTFWEAAMASTGNVAFVARLFILQHSTAGIGNAVTLLERALSSTYANSSLLWLLYLCIRSYLMQHAQTVSELNARGVRCDMEIGIFASSRLPRYAQKDLEHSEEMKDILERSQLDPRLTHRVMRDLLAGTWTKSRKRSLAESDTPGSGHRELTFFQRFCLDVLQITLISISSGTAGVDSDSMMMQTLLAAPQFQSMTCFESLRSFWNVLLDENPAVEKLPPLISAIHEHSAKATSGFETLSMRFGRDPRVLRSFSRFLMYVESDPARAHELLDDASVYEEEETNRRIQRATSMSIYQSSSSLAFSNNGTRAASMVPRMIKAPAHTSISASASPSVSPSVDRPSNHPTALLTHAQSLKRRSAFQFSPNKDDNTPVFIGNVSSEATNEMEPAAHGGLDDERSGTWENENNALNADNLSTASAVDRQYAVVSAWRRRLQSSCSSTFSQLRIATIAAILLLVLGVIGTFVVQKVLLNGYSLHSTTVDISSQSQSWSAMSLFYTRTMSLANSTFEMAGLDQVFSASSIPSRIVLQAAEIGWMVGNLTSPSSSSLSNEAVSTIFDSNAYAPAVYNPIADQFATGVVLSFRDLAARFIVSAGIVTNLTTTSVTSLSVDASYRFLADNCPNVMFSSLGSVISKISSYVLEQDVILRNVLIALLILAVLLPVILYLALFRPSLQRFKKERDEVFHLFTTIPKSVVRKVYIQVGGRDGNVTHQKDPRSAEIVAEQFGTSPFESDSAGQLSYKKDPAKRLTACFLGTSLILLCVMCVFCAQGLVYVAQYRYRTNNVVYAAGRSSQASLLHALALELISNDSRTWPSGTNQVRHAMSKSISTMLTYDLAVRTGSESLGTPGSDGDVPQLDTLYYTQRCSDGSSFHCWSCVGFLSQYVDALNQWIATPDSALSYSSPVLHRIILFHTSLSSACLLPEYELYRSQYDNNVNTMTLTSDIIFGCVIPVALVMLMLLFFSLQELEADARITRMMFLQLPAQFIEANDHILAVVINSGSRRSQMAGVDTSLTNASRNELVARVQASEKRAKRIVETSGDGIVELTKDYDEPQIESFNEVFQTMMNAKSTGALAGRYFLSMVNGNENRRTISSVLKALIEESLSSTSKKKRVESVLCRSDGSLFNVRLDIVETDASFVAFVRDMTDDIRKEKLLSFEKKRSDDLLRNTLPDTIVRRLQNGETVIADYTESCSLFFSDMVSFTELSSRLTPVQLVNMLNTLVSCMDRLAKHYGVEKIKTVGDSYFAVCGVPEPMHDHAERMMEFSMAVLKLVDILNSDGRLLVKEQVRLRIGNHTGPVVAGVIGESKFAFDLWSDSVNVASRMESSGDPFRIHVSRATYEALYGKYDFEDRGFTQIKGKGEMQTFFVKQRLTESHFPDPDWQNILSSQPPDLSVLTM
eukprot:ANDGO_04537.mRNA.1 Adenylate cyclase